MAKKEKASRWEPSDPDDARSVASAAALAAYEKEFGPLPVQTPEQIALLEVALRKGEDNKAETR